MTTIHTYCRLCEGICGLAVEVEEGRVTKIEPDRSHPLSRGFVCLKGMNSASILYHKDRVLAPQKRGISGWERVSWSEAFAAIGGKLREIRDTYGPDAL